LVKPPLYSFGRNPFREVSSNLLKDGRAPTREIEPCFRQAKQRVAKDVGIENTGIEKEGFGQSDLSVCSLVGSPVR
jgi:hypothetical protein